jgi:hypothetical protein
MTKPRVAGVLSFNGMTSAYRMAKPHSVSSHHVSPIFTLPLHLVHDGPLCFAGTLSYFFA